MTLSNYLNLIGYGFIGLLFVFLLNPYSLAIPTGYLIIVTLIIFKGRELFYYCLDKNFLVLLAFSVTYAIFDAFGENRGIQFLIIEATFPCFFYALGKIMVNSPRLSNKDVFYILLSIGFVYSLSAILSIVMNILKGGFAQTSRMIPSIWDGKEMKSTGVAGFLIYNTLIPAILIAYRKQLSLSIKLFLGFLFGVTLISGFRLGSRTLLAVAGLSFTISLIIALREQKPLDSLKLISTLVLVVSVILFIFPINFDSPIFSTLAYRLQNTSAAESTATAGGRTGLWADGFEKLFTHPLGWTSKRFHHNVWLDAAKVAGVIPLFFLLLNTISCFISVKNLFSFSKGNIDLGLRIAFLLYFLATFLLFFTEPVIEGNFLAFVVYCLFFGILIGFLEKQKSYKL